VEQTTVVLLVSCVANRWNQYRLYVPADEVNPKDVLLWVHGGGFVLGSITGETVVTVLNYLTFSRVSN
jgi:acetyl esterase/lipase